MRAISASTAHCSAMYPPAWTRPESCSTATPNRTDSTSSLSSSLSATTDGGGALGARLLLGPFLHCSARGAELARVAVLLGLLGVDRAGQRSERANEYLAFLGTVCGSDYTPFFHDFHDLGGSVVA